MCELPWKTLNSIKCMHISYIHRYNLINSTFHKWKTKRMKWTTNIGNYWICIWHTCGTHREAFTQCFQPYQTCNINLMSKQTHPAGCLRIGRRHMTALNHTNMSAYTHIYTYICTCVAAERERVRRLPCQCRCRIILCEWERNAGRDFKYVLLELL